VKSSDLNGIEHKLGTQYYFLAQRVMFLTKDELVNIIGAKSTDVPDCKRPTEYRCEGCFLPVWKHESWSYTSSGMCCVFDFQIDSSPALTEKGAFIFLTVVEAEGNAAQQSTYPGADLHAATEQQEQIRQGDEDQNRQREGDQNKRSEVDKDDEANRQFLLQQFFFFPTLCLHRFQIFQSTLARWK